jgi:DNA polymerase elongation subunit (family B)
MMYEDDPTKCKRKSMGIVLKRRDNAPIVKDVFGGALDMLLDRKPVAEAADFVKSMLTRILKADVPIEKFVITKQLRDDYKDRTKIAHRVLADRMTKRDPGNAPNVGDRMQFVYIKKQTQDKKVLQGDRIEDLQYVKDNKLLPDSEFYITNQIQNPVASLFALCIEKMTGFKQPSTSYAELYNTALERAKSETVEEKEEEATLWVLDQKEKQLDTLLFLGNSELKKIVVGNQRGPMDAFLKKKV